jgi:hypothetical protein
VGRARYVHVVFVWFALLAAGLGYPVPVSAQPYERPQQIECLRRQVHFLAVTQQLPRAAVQREPLEPIAPRYVGAAF